MNTIIKSSKIFKNGFFFKINKLNYSTKFPTKAFINGVWMTNNEGMTFDVLNPATGDKISDVPDLSIKETDHAIKCADKAFESWARSTALDRSNLLRKLYDLLTEHEDEISRIVTMENGKCLEEAKVEVRYAANFLDWFSEESRRVMGFIIPPPKADKKLIVLQQPIGVVGMIAPWNFPLAMVTRKLGAILAAGCTTVIKPAEDTPLSLLKFMEIAEKEIPPGVINVVTASRSNSPLVGRVLCTDTRVKSVTFTGSSEVGKILYAQSADTVKRLSLELGGNAPFIVFESANLDVTVKGALASKFRNSGQACIAANRIFVHESVHDEFISKLISGTAKLKLGYGLDEGVNQGPLINQDAVRKVEQLINRSVELGAHVKSGGKRAIVENCPQGYFFQPTVITDCDSNHPLFKNEIFGPVCAVTKFSSEEDFIRMENSQRTGLAGYLFSEDHRQIWRVAEQLQIGMIGINEVALSHCEAPFQGWKESGLGTESGMFGIEEFLLKKYICWGNLC